MHHLRSKRDDKQWESLSCNRLRVNITFHPCQSNETHQSVHVTRQKNSTLASIILLSEYDNLSLPESPAPSVGLHSWLSDFWMPNLRRLLTFEVKSACRVVAPCVVVSVRSMVTFPKSVGAWEWSSVLKLFCFKIGLIWVCLPLLEDAFPSSAETY